ncbi:RING [Seminavis robusta]|uniref:RING n=1 Tax=Seminavis robusta TaxID=568900 RepID=A0A9N8EA34_9STRA|nr:RING [Seminavis robusta]|eukprot:Sro663_g183490.1 RING (722) ;mRNA; r:21512-23677
MDSPQFLASISAAGNGAKSKNGNDPPLRQGKWTREEEEYVACLIDEFKTGMMPLAEGTSLRTFLSKMLNCHPMRISKKFVGSNYNGKQVYARRTGSDRLSNEQVRERRAKLCDLERKFLAKIQGKTGASATPAAQQQMQQQMQAMQQQRQQTSANPHLSLTSLGGGGGMGSAGGINRVSASGLELRNLLNQASNPSGAGLADLPRNVSLLGAGHPSSGSLASSHSLSGLFADLSNSAGNMAGMGAAGLNTSNSLEAFQMFMQQQQSTNNPLLSGTTQHTHKSNSRAAAAGRALLQSGGGLGLGGGDGGGNDNDDDQKAAAAKPAASPGGINGKPLADFSSAELAAELRKRSSLKDLVASLGGGGGNISQSSLANFQDSIQQAAGASQNASAFSTLIRNSSLGSGIDMSNLIERQGSIDSLSNLAIRSRLQSIQSMGSLLDPLLGDGKKAATGSGGENNNSNWTPSQAAGLGHSSAASSSIMSSLNMNELDLLAGKLGGGAGSSATASNLMQSLGSAEQIRTAFSNSGLNLASLLNNDDALRRLEASAPSSLNQNFSFSAAAAGASKRDSLSSRSERDRGRSDPPAAGGSDENTAIAQFLLQKKLLEQQQQQGGSRGNLLGGNGGGGNSEQEHFMRSVAAASGGAGSSRAGMDPIMSSLLSSMQSGNGKSRQGGTDPDGKSQEADNESGTMEALKRKYLSGGAGQGDLMAAMEQHRRNKPFR